ncbi:hypothetical protein A9Q78_07545 [Methylophaga sp. 41_12_T18]|nr:hypothetical protein A9Q78_07545 [Methylophaga sp. 41_12_T18]
MDSESRQYIRHPIAIPLHVSSNKVQAYQQNQVKDLSHGGLCFACEHHHAAGETVKITISVCHPEFHAEGIVRWCKNIEDNYLIGIVFLEKDVLFAMRMVEQVCYIEDYRQQQSVLTGVEMSSEKAALEWLPKYASQFPKL